MHLAPVTSSQLLRAGFHEDSNTFVTQFADGKNEIYAYFNVDPLLADGFDEAESKGSFFIREIRGKRGEPKHNYKKLGGADLLDADGNISDDVLSFPMESAVFTKPQGKPLPPAPDIHKPKAEVLPPVKVDLIPALPEKDEELRTVALTVQQRASGMLIANGADYAHVEGFLLTIKATFRTVRDRLQQVVDPTLAAYRAAVKLRDEAIQPYEEAERILKQKMLVYSREEEEKRRSEERRLTAERQEQARKDAAEQSRIEAEQTAQVYEAQGELEVAASVRANPLPLAPAPVAPVVLERDVPKGKSSIKEKWSYRITNEAAIPMTHQFYSLDEKKLAAYAKTMKANGSIPGLDIFDEGSIAARIK